MPAENDDPVDGHTYVRIPCFVNAEEIKAFDKSVIDLMVELRDVKTRTLVSEENVLVYNHGGGWHRPAASEASDIKMHKIESSWEIPWQSLLDNDLSLIAGTLTSVTEDIGRQFATNVYAMVGEIAESVGNVVDAREHPNLAEGFLEALKKVEFDIDRDGKVSLPAYHVSPDTGDKLVNELKSQPPEFSAEIERIKAVKTKAAFAREAKRKAKFRTVQS
jgi:hypothetical protein